MPRRTRHIRRRGSPPARPLRPAADLDPAARVRALVQEGIVAAAAMTACEDLERAVASTQRLGALTSGMWRALSRELATAAERLDRSTVERVEDIARRARTLDVDADEVITAGLAAGHLEQHRETLETLVPRLDDGHMLIEPNMLFGLSVADPLLDEHLLGDEDEPQDDDDAPLAMTITMSLFFWPAPLLPASVSIVPSLADDADAAPFDLTTTAPEPLLEALSQASGLSIERVSQALVALGSACWTAHLQDDQLDENDANNDDDDDDDDFSDEEDQSLGVEDAPDA